MNKLKYILVAANLFTLVAVIYLLTSGGKEKSGYFLSANVYNEFEYKKELEADLESSKNFMQGTLDSMERDLKATIAFMEVNAPTKDELIVLQRKQNGYIEYRDYVENDYATKVEEYYTLIWERINGYVKEYGEENEYQYIFGANGDGSVMYADASSDITDEVIVYINQRYEGE